MGDRVRIEVRRLVLAARIGVTDIEREHERELVVDLDVEPPEVGATATDAIGETVDYARLASEAARVADDGPHRTLERLAARIAERALEQAGEGSRVRVRVAKSDPPMRERAGEVAVTLERGAR